ncbi:hypothetical protein [Vreelandella sp. EE22]
MLKLGYARIQTAPRPDGDVVTPGPVEETEEGVWQRTWSVRDFTPEERAGRLEADREDKIREINDAYSDQVHPLIRDYPEPEQQTWASQDAEARAYLAWYNVQQGEPPATPVLDNILAGRNADDGTETLHDLCLAVRENAELFTQAQQLTGKRQRLVKQAREAQTREALEVISW